LYAKLEHYKNEGYWRPNLLLAGTTTRSFMDTATFRASGLNLVVSAIVHWNTVYLARVAAHLRAKGKSIPDDLLRHVSPLSGSTSI
jgi:hypothetical protein